MQTENKKEHPDLIYIPEQDIYKLKHKTLHIFYPSVEVYEEQKKISEETNKEMLSKVLWKK